MPKNAQAGVTLIEILIAVSLLSLLSVGALVAMQLGLRTMDKTDARMVGNRRVTSARNILESEVGGFFPTLAVVPQANNRTVPFFGAEPQSMRFVSTYSLEDAWRGHPQIVALQVMPGENNTGVRLIVNEIPYTGQAQAGQLITGLEPDPLGRLRPVFVPAAAGAGSFVVADRLRYCRFSYLYRLPTAPFDSWEPGWALGQPYPVAVRIEMASLDTSPADLRATTVTMPIPVTTFPGTMYVQ